MPDITIAIKPMPASSTQPKVMVSSGANGSQDAAFDAIVSLSGLAPGEYVLEVAARLGDGKPVIREVPLSVR